MTYKGDDSFKTNFGACLTLFFWMGIIGIIVAQALMYVQNVNSNV